MAVLWLNMLCSYSYTVLLPPTYLWANQTLSFIPELLDLERCVSQKSTKVNTPKVQSSSNIRGLNLSFLHPCLRRLVNIYLSWYYFCKQALSFPIGFSRKQTRLYYGPLSSDVQIRDLLLNPHALLLPCSKSFESYCSLHNLTVPLPFMWFSALNSDRVHFPPFPIPLMYVCRMVSLCKITPTRIVSYERDVYLKGWLSCFVGFVPR